MLIVNIVTALIAFLALLVSWGSYRLAHKSLVISKQQSERKEPKLSFQINEKFYKVIQENKVFFVALTISNQADTDNTITGCELKITYRREGSKSGNILLSHDPSLITQFKGNELSPLLIPAHVKAHGAELGVTIFKLDKELDQELCPEKYEIYFRDAHGLESHVDITIVKDFESAEVA